LAFTASVSSADRKGVATGHSSRNSYEVRLCRRSRCSVGFEGSLRLQLKPTQLLQIDQIRLVLVSPPIHFSEIEEFFQGIFMAPQQIFVHILRQRIASQSALVVVLHPA